MSADEKDYITDSLNAMYIRRDLLGLYNDFLESTDRKPLDTYITGLEDESEDEEDSDVSYNEDGAKNGFVYIRKKEGYLRSDIIPYEDVYPILYLRYSLFNMNEERPIKHLVIDEMQDYTYLQYRLIEKVFSCAMTILGDKAQTMECECRDVLEFLPSVFSKELYSMELTKSYRSTLEITRYAASLMGYDTISSIDRHGEAVGEHTFTDDDELIRSIAEIIRNTKDKAETIAVLCKNASRTSEIYSLLCEDASIPEIRILTSDTSSFKTGVSVSPFYLTKGLEFDIVIIVDEEFEPEALHKQALYIEATRALHVLHIFKRR